VHYNLYFQFSPNYYSNLYYFYSNPITTLKFILLIHSSGGSQFEDPSPGHWTLRSSKSRDWGGSKATILFLLSIRWCIPPHLQTTFYHTRT